MAQSHFIIDALHGFSSFVYSCASGHLLQYILQSKMFMTEGLKKNNQNQPTKDQNKKKKELV